MAPKSTLTIKMPWLQSSWLVHLPLQPL